MLARTAFFARDDDPVLGDIDRNVIWFKAGERSCQHDVFVTVIDPNWNLLRFVHKESSCIRVTQGICRIVNANRFSAMRWSMNERRVAQQLSALQTPAVTNFTQIPDANLQR
jgi:hypothetical protein